MNGFFPTVIPNEQDNRKQNIVIRNLVDGKSNNTGLVTLTPNAPITVVTDLRAGGGSYINFMATTANAAAELAAGTLYVSDRGKNTFTISHANAAQADRTFKYIIVG